MIPQLLSFSKLNVTILWTVVERLLDPESDVPEDVEAFRAHVAAAAELAVKVGVYLATGEQPRDLKTAALVTQAAEAYQAEVASE